MPPVKSLNVLGDKIDILVNGQMTNGASATFIQTTKPGGGPPPHRHSREDETFTVLEGEFELLIDGQWKATVGEVFFAPRGGVHTFRNSGSTIGRILVFIAPAGFENFFEKVSGLNPESDMPKILEACTEYGYPCTPQRRETYRELAHCPQHPSRIQSIMEG